MGSLHPEPKARPVCASNTEANRPKNIKIASSFPFSAALLDANISYSIQNKELIRGARFTRVSVLKCTRKHAVPVRAFDHAKASNGLSALKKRDKHVHKMQIRLDDSGRELISGRPNLMVPAYPREPHGESNQLRT